MYHSRYWSPRVSVMSPSFSRPALITSTVFAWTSCSDAPGRGRLDALFLRLQHDPVDVFLQRRERAADRIGPRDVARHVAVVAGGVDEQEVAGLHLPVAVGVVQDGRVRPAADNRRIAPRDGAAAAVHRLDRGFHLVLVGAGARGAHAGHLRLAGDLEALDQDLALVRRLHRPQIVENRHRVDGVEADEPLANPLGELQRRARRVGEAAAGVQRERDMGAARRQRVEESRRLLRA